MANNHRSLDSSRVQAFVESVVEDDLHAKRVLSISNATLGAIHAGSLAVHAMGQGLAQARGLIQKHAIKQVDRLLSNRGIVVWQFFASWVPFVVGSRQEIVVAMDWTDFDNDGHTVIALYLVTTHGRATPLLWKSVLKAELKGNRNDFEDEALIRLKEVLPEGVKVTILADRGFGDQKLYELLFGLGFDFVIRFREAITVTSELGDSRPASQWVPLNGRPKLLRNAKVTGSGYQLPTVVCVKAPRMKDAWCLAASQPTVLASTIVNLYGKRFTIEETFRDGKDIHFGMGLSATHIGGRDRRDRLLLVAAMAQVLLTLLGAAGESLGMERLLKANTSKKRTYSLFRQGCLYYALIPTMKEERLRPLIERFVELLAEHAVFRQVFGVI